MSILTEMQNHIIGDELDIILEEGYEELNNIKKSNLKTVPICEDGGLISIPLIISLVTAAPGLIKTLTGIAQKILVKFKMMNPDNNIMDSVIKLADKWHHMYIKVIQFAMEKLGLFKKAGITYPEQKKRTAEVIFYVLVFGLAVFSGVSTAKHIKHALDTAHFTNLNMTTLEAVLTAIKSKEVIAFVKELA